MAKNENRNPQISIVFYDREDNSSGKPGLIIDGKYIGRIERMEFTRSGMGLLDLRLKGMRVHPGSRMLGVPSVKEDIPEHLDQVIELSHGGSFEVVTAKTEEEEKKGRRRR